MAGLPVSVVLILIALDACYLVGGLAMSELLEHRGNGDQRSLRRRELLTFLVLAFGIWPLVAVGVVGGYGFIVWMYQIVFGPPGPPGH